jgi:hypothetical protein
MPFPIATNGRRGLAGRCAGGLRLYVNDKRLSLCARWTTRPKLEASTTITALSALSESICILWLWSTEGLIRYLPLRLRWTSTRPLKSCPAQRPKHLSLLDMQMNTRQCRAICATAEKSNFGSTPNVRPS